MTPHKLRKLLKDMNLSQLELADFLIQNKFYVYTNQQYSQPIISNLLRADFLTERFRNHVDLLQKFANEA
jgi:transcriptional regulator with XRE-family HTH domain